MSLPDTTETLQSELSALGFYRGKIDGLFGAKSNSALDAYASSLPSARGKILSAPGWSFTARIDHGDIMLENVSATWFGGDSDPLDNGETASGILTKGNPSLIGCSLPMDMGNRVPNTKGSPLPLFPWRTNVEVSYNGKTLICPLIDVGPARWAGDALDLTVAAFQFFAGPQYRKLGVLKNVTARIIGGSKYC